MQNVAQLLTLFAVPSRVFLLVPSQPWLLLALAENCIEKGEAEAGSVSGSDSDSVSVSGPVLRTGGDPDRRLVAPGKGTRRKNQWVVGRL